MADNVAITAGSGTSVATDDIAGIHYQRVKLSIGADGAAADLAHGSAVSASSLPVVIASDQVAVAIKAATGVIVDIAPLVAHDAVDAQAPMKIGGQARTTNPVAVADADRTNLIADKLGKLVVVGSIRDLKARQATTITSSVAETTIVTAAVSVFHDIFRIQISNSSATGTLVTIKDATAGTTVGILWVAAGAVVGFSAPESGAWNQTAVNNNWTATCTTSVASIYVIADFVKNI